MGLYRLRFTPEAVKDISEASDYYESQKIGLGKRFRSEVKQKLLLLKENPAIYALRYKDVRFTLIDIFPYSIHFTIQQSSHIVLIHGVLCQFRNPQTYWKDFDDVT